MLCESCHQQTATVHLTTIVAGEKTEQHLCAACCQKHKQALTVAGMNTLLASFFQATVQQPPASALRCEHCGQSFEQFKKMGVLGCAHCYEEFRTQLKPMLQKIHGRSQHAGRLPREADDALRHRRQLETLRKEMDQAISDENFERAAELRDLLRTMLPAKEGETHASV